MTFVEFFEEIAAENICACLTYTPDRVIYIGDKPKRMREHIENYEKVFNDAKTGRGKNIEFLYKNASKSNLDNAVEVISEIVETYDDCVFGITGGEEILTVALGVVYERYRDREIKIHRFNINENTICDCDKDGKTIYKESPALSIDENIKIYGGEIVYGDIDSDDTYLWDYTPDFLNDIDLIWECSKDSFRSWNKQISIFAAAEEEAKAHGGISADKLTTTVSRIALERRLAREGKQYYYIKKIVNDLLKKGLLTSFVEDATTLTVSYKNVQVKKCLTNEGRALEMKICAIAREVRDNGVKVYNDVLQGVAINWDGEFHNQKTDGVYDTENEIDVMMMHGIVPVYISCKNGNVKADELYKLETVSERFGGPYTKRVLVATSLDTMGDAGEAVRQRAEDMGIRVLKIDKSMTDKDLEKKLRFLWKS